ncbi:MAG: ABC transporter permease [Candidatus Izemoplasmatales bacterium]
MIASALSRFRRTVVLFFRRPGIKKTTRILGSVLKVGFFLGVMLILYLPIVFIAIQSVNQSNSLYNFSGFTFEYWLNVLTFDIPSKAVENAITTTMLVAIIATVVATVAGTIFAIGIHSLSRRKRQGMVILNQVPILNADIITGISMMMVFRLLLNLIPDAFQFGFVTLVIAHIFFCIPYVVLSVLPKLAELDDNLYDAALDLGCTPASGIVKVIVPAIGSGILSGMLIAFTMSIDDYLISLFNAGQRGIGGDNLSMYVYNAANRIIEHEVYAFSSILSTGVFVLLLAIYLRSALKKKSAERHKVLSQQKI